MTLRLTRLDANLPITAEGASPSQQFLRLDQRMKEAIEGQEATQDATINRIRRMMSHTSPTTILTTVDNGATATITVAAHTRVYADGTTLAVAGGTQAALASDTPHAVYYDDTTMADTTPTYVFTTTLLTAQAATAEGRHFCGVIRTPPAGSGQTRLGGGAYPASSSIGGEV